MTAAAVAAPPRTNILQLQPAPDAPQINQPADGLTARIQADTARLFSLSMWLKKSSTQIGALTLTSNSKYASRSLDFWQRSLLLPGMASVMQAMAAGRAAQGGMRLTAMDLEVRTTGNWLLEAAGVPCMGGFGTCTRRGTQRAAVSGSMI